MSVPIVFSSIFSSFPQVKFGFSTRQDGINSEVFGLNVSFGVGDDRSNVGEHQRRFLESLSIVRGDLAIPKQVHGSTVQRVTHPGLYDDCDALITNEADVFLSITVADCLPIFLFDPSSQSIGAVHAGWRGCAQNIVQKTVLRMAAECSAKLETMRVYVGPSARSCCYEVGEEVASQFDEKFLIRKTGARPHLDMQAFTVAVLSEMGIQNSQIEISQYCTICTPELFHSYRRDGARSGRMIGVIGLVRY